MVMPLGEPLPNGTYVMTYRVISADTHPVGAAIVFSVGEPIAGPGALAAARSQASSPWTWAVAANRWILYAAMLVATGSALFLILFSVPPAVVNPTVALARAATLVGALAYLVAIGVGGAGCSSPARARCSKRRRGPGVSPARCCRAPCSACRRCCCCGGRWVAAAGAGASAALMVGAGAAIASFLVTGHAATAAPVWLMATMVGLHLLATAFWMGALFPLQRAAGTLGADEAGALMNRFSRFGVVAVATTLLSGMVISWVQLDGPANLLGNDYGESLVRKLVIVAIVIGVALYNKFRLTPALERGEAGSTARIRRSIRVEYALYVVVVGAAMSLTLPTPPRATAAQGAAGGTMAMATEGFKATVQSAEGYSVEIDLSPARPGENMLMATVRDPAGTLLDGMAALEVVIALDAAGISDVRTKAEDVGNGMWHAMIQEMLIPGEWTVQVDAYVTDYDKITFSTPVTIR
ncbi:MAG: CopD family protein [Steroidobacteraceae bacterium]